MKNQNGSNASAVLGFSRQHLSRLEQGKATATREQALAIREYLGVPVLEVGHLSKFTELQREVGLRPFAVGALRLHWGLTNVRPGRDAPELASEGQAGIRYVTSSQARPFFRGQRAQSAGAGLHLDAHPRALLDLALQ